jgi:hypothetical protein
MTSRPIEGSSYEICRYCSTLAVRAQLAQMRNVAEDFAHVCPRIATVKMKTNSPREVAGFWCELLGYGIAPNHSPLRASAH